MSIKKNKTRRVCIAIITDEKDNILMGKRNDNGKWTTVGGHAEKNEDPYVAMVREAKEEANIDVKNIKMVRAEWNRDKNLLIYLFKIEMDSSTVIHSENDPDNECEDWFFVDPNEVAEELHVPLPDNVALKYWSSN